MRKWQQLAVTVAIVAAVGTAGGGIGVGAEDTDPGDLPATARALGATSSVAGSLVTNDTDLYRLCIGDAGMTASTVGGTSLDTVLYIFDADGRGIAMNDDASSSRQSAITLPPTAGPATYHVAVTGFGHAPFGTDGLAMFGGGNEGAVQDAARVLGEWRNGHTKDGDYTLALDGAVDCPAPTDPEPQDPGSPNDGSDVTALTLDVLPGGDDRSISSRGRGRIPMVVSVGADLDPSDLDRASIAVGDRRIAPVKVQVRGGALLLLVEAAALELAPGEQQLCVALTPADGPAQRACDTVRVR